jgi:hypothetical protein
MLPTILEERSLPAEEGLGATEVEAFAEAEGTAEAEVEVGKAVLLQVELTRYPIK